MSNVVTTTSPHRRPRDGPGFLVAVVFALLAPATMAERATVRIAGVEYLGDLPTRVAERTGLFADQRIDAAIEYGPSGRDNLRALRAGEVDYALMALAPLAIDLLADPDPRGPDDPVILASLVHSTRLNQVVALADGGPASPAALAGARIGLMRGTNAEFAWSLFSAFHGLDPAGVTLVDRPVEELGEALTRGEVDAAVLWQPWTHRLGQRHQGDITEFAGSNIYTAKWVLVTRRRLAARQPGQARRLLAAYREAIRIIHDDPQRAGALYPEYEGDGFLDAQRASILFGLGLDWSLLASLRQQLDWARRAGYRDAGVPQDILARIDAGPLRTLAPARVGIPSASGDSTAEREAGQ